MSNIQIYQIIEWNFRFENSRSREIEVCSWVGIPNKHHGMGFTRILSSPEGLATYGLWCLIVQACSRQASTKLRKRNGWLTDDGTATGNPWDASDLAVRWRQSADFVQQGLDLFCSPKVGWMILHQKLPNVDQLNGSPSADDWQVDVCDSPPRATRREGNRTEGKRTPPTSSARYHIKGIEPEAIQQALLQQDYIGIIKAFGGNVSPSRISEWGRDTDQIMTHELVAIFAWMREQKNHIREPSGFRKAREEWLAIAINERRELAKNLLNSHGIELPPPLKPKDEGESVA